MLLYTVSLCSDIWQLTVELLLCVCVCSVSDETAWHIQAWGHCRVMTHPKFWSGENSIIGLYM